MSESGTRSLTAATLANQFGWQHNVVLENLKGVTHEESLAAPAGGGNCINWIVGHIVASRRDVHRLAGAVDFWTEEEAKVYERGSAPITADAAKPLADLLDLYAESQRILAKKLEEVDDETLARPAGKSSTVGRSLAFLSFHEAYHTGQTGILRRTIGKEGAIK